MEVPITSPKEKLRKNERNAKGNLVFLFVTGWQAIKKNQDNCLFEI